MFVFLSLTLFSARITTLKTLLVPKTQELQKRERGDPHLCSQTCPNAIVWSLSSFYFRALSLEAEAGTTGEEKVSQKGPLWVS